MSDHQRASTAITSQTETEFFPDPGFGHWLFKFKWPVIIIGFFYLLTHLTKLTSLPVFADEAIYIRWAQLIIDDWQQYLFFPLNDGKTPLFVWLLIPWQFVFNDQLWAGRWLAVMVGLGQVITNGYLVFLLGGKKQTVWSSMLLTSILPFWFFHHRLALMDGLLTLFLTWVWIGAGKLVTDRRWSFTAFCLTGISLGLALLTKLPALLIIPCLILLVLFPIKLSWKQRLIKSVQLGLAIFLGLIIFVSLKLHPAFGQLFGRGSDFLFPWEEIVLAGGWQTTIRNWPTYVSYISAYLTFGVLFLSIIGLFWPSRQ